jgi:hypothetical protein
MATHNPLMEDFAEGSVQHNELKKYMLANGHGGMMLMHSPIVRDLKVGTFDDASLFGREPSCSPMRWHRCSLNQVCWM